MRRLLDRIAYVAAYGPSSFPDEDRTSLEAELTAAFAELDAIIGRARKPHVLQALRLARLELESARDSYHQGAEMKANDHMSHVERHLSEAQAGKPIRTDYVASATGITVKVEADDGNVN